MSQKFRYIIAREKRFALSTSKFLRQQEKVRRSRRSSRFTAALQPHLHICEFDSEHSFTAGDDIMKKFVTIFAIEQHFERILLDATLKVTILEGCFVFALLVTPYPNDPKSLDQNDTNLYRNSRKSITWSVVHYDPLVSM